MSFKLNLCIALIGCESQAQHYYVIESDERALFNGWYRLQHDAPSNVHELLSDDIGALELTNDIYKNVYHDYYFIVVALDESGAPEERIDYFDWGTVCYSKYSRVSINNTNFTARHVAVNDSDPYLIAQKMATTFSTTPEDLFMRRYDLHSLDEQSIINLHASLFLTHSMKYSVSIITKTSEDEHLFMFVELARVPPIIVRTVSQVTMSCPTFPESQVKLVAYESTGREIYLIFGYPTEADHVQIFSNWGRPI